MKYIAPKKLKVLMLMFFGVGIWGIFFGITQAPQNAILIITLLGVINIGLGCLVAYLYITQGPKPDRKKKKRM